METVKEYKIIHGKTPEDLEKKVNALIQQGWKPLGGVSITMRTQPDGAGNWWVAQAMVR